MLALVLPSFGKIGQDRAQLLHLLGADLLRPIRFHGGSDGLDSLVEGGLPRPVSRISRRLPFVGSVYRSR